MTTPRRATSSIAEDVAAVQERITGEYAANAYQRRAIAHLQEALDELAEGGTPAPQLSGASRKGSE